MKWETKLLLDNRIAGFSEWKNTGLVDTLSEGWGVFIFASRDENVLFIGSAAKKSIIECIKYELSQRQLKDVEIVKVIYTKFPEYVIPVTEKLISFYNPPGNFDDVKNISRKITDQFKTLSFRGRNFIDMVFK